MRLVSLPRGAPVDSINRRVPEAETINVCIAYELILRGTLYRDVLVSKPITVSESTTSFSVIIRFIQNKT